MATLWSCSVCGHIADHRGRGDCSACGYCLRAVSASAAWRARNTAAMARADEAFYRREEQRIRDYDDGIIAGDDR